MKAIISKIKVNRVILWITIIQFFITGAFYWFSYNKLSESDFNAEPGYTKLVKEEVSKIENAYQLQKVRYETTIDSLQKQLGITNYVLHREKEYSDSQKAELESLLQSNWDSLTPQQYVYQCDSLRQQTQNFLIADAQKDSLLELKNIQLEAIHEHALELFNQCDSSYNRLKEQIDTALYHTQLCEQQLKRQKRNNRIWKIAAGALGVFTIGLALK